MADHCCFCDTRRPLGGTKHLVLNGGEIWLEFCPDCGKKETLTNPEIGTVTIAELWSSLEEGRDPQPIKEEQDSFGNLSNFFD